MLVDDSMVQLPDLQTLTSVVNAVFGGNESADEQVTILDRESNIFTSTYSSMVVTCQLADGSEVRLLCKYSTGSDHNAYGHRGGVAYEAEVYRQVLQHLPVSTPRFYGHYRDEINNGIWILLEFLDEGLRIHYHPEIYHEAARWLGQFHRANEELLTPASLPFLKKYDAEYYLRWADMTLLHADQTDWHFPWLATLCRRYEKVVDMLLELPEIIIHGEYYPDNILRREGTIYPVDWESTAVAVGEIDLVSLIEGWPPEIVGNCKAEYRSVRWPDGAPEDFEGKLKAAGLYWQFRWLGDQHEWATEEKKQWRFDKLRSIGERLGLI